ncbi:MAG: translation initiation factor IF-2, partial [Clostridia bacterium]
GERRPYNNNNSGERRPYNSNYNNNNNGGERRPYNNNNGGAQTGERRPYNSNYQGGERRPYNNNNNDGERRPYNSNYNNNNSNSGERRPYNNNYNNNNNNGGERRPYNNNYNNNNNASGERRPYNNNYGNNNGGERRPYNNNGGGRFNNDGNSSYQVNKFIKTAEKLPIEQKEMKEYSQNLITKDKERFNGENKSIDKKQDKKNKNAIREQNSRVDLAKIKGLEVDTNKGMYELYDRNIDRRRARKTRRVREESKQTLIIPMTEVTLPEEMTVKMFAESIKKTSAEVIKKLFKLGILATLNQEIDFDTAFLIAEEYGITAKKEVVVTEEDILFDESEDKEDELESRPPIVVVMGHVDHGKTSILDRIRKANVQSGEAGGITQHIGAYKVKVQDKEITFLDTPGHEAFTAMRARGAQVTDIAIIVVAADDGIMPQTVEAINHAKAAEVSIIVAINKIDKPGANIDKVKQELLEAGLVPEEWGGDTICVPVSAVTGEGMDTLLEMVLLVAEVKDLKSNPNKQAKGTVIEAKLDKNKGTVASLLVQRGSLNVGDTIVCGEVIGRVRAMTDDKGRKVKVAGPSTPVEIMGLSSVPETGDIFYEVENEKVAKQLIEKRKGTKRATLIKQGAKVTLEDLFSQIKQGEVKDLNVIIKADLQGSVQALKDSLEKISNEEVRVRVIHGAAGAISESDVTLAMVSNAIIIGFNVRPNAVAASIAEKEKVNLRLYRVIYDAINDVQAAMKGMLAPTFKEVVHGTAEVRSIFKITDVGTVCGCYVKSGKVIRNGLIRVIRDNVVIAEDKIDSLKRMKDDAKEVAENYECGIKLDKFNDIKELDTLECFELVEEKK